MWEESWPNLMMKMADMPYYKYKSSKDKKKDKPGKKEDFEDGAKPGNEDILKEKFAKYIQK